MRPVHNDEKCAEERLTQRRSQDADANAAANADAAAGLPTTDHDLHADATGAKKPLARVTKSGRGAGPPKYRAVAYWFFGCGGLVAAWCPWATHPFHNGPA